MAVFRPLLGQWTDPNTPTESTSPSAEFIGGVMRTLSREARRGQENAVQHNFTNSQLCKLPVELILVIAEQLESGSDWLSLGASCGKLYKALKLAKAPATNDTSRAALYDLFYPNFNLICTSEDDGRLSESLRACSGCRRIHSHHLFSKAELRTPPRERMCRGRQARFRLCEHATYSYDDLTDFVAKQADAPPTLEKRYASRPYRGDIVCFHPSHGDEHYGRPTIIAARNPRGKAFLQSRTRQMLFETGGIRCENVRNRLAAMDRRICPHKSIRDANMSKGDGEYGTRIHLRCDACDFPLNRKHPDDRRFVAADEGWRAVFLYAIRRTFIFEGPNSLEWLSRVESP